MDINGKHIVSKKRVGTLHGKAVIELLTKGGLNLIVSEKDGKAVILGSGPHRAVSRYIAERKEPDMVWTELSKSDWLDAASILSVADKYSSLTDILNKALSE